MSGVKAEMTGTILSWMQDEEADGVICLGPAGAAKSAVAKATGNTAGRPTIALDFSGLQHSLVGSSGEFLRTALQIIKAVSGGRSLWIATCNSVASLPTELMRRFSQGRYFFDLPDLDEQTVIWDIYRRKYNLGDKLDLSGFDYAGWTGAEIKTCCMKSYRQGISLKEAAAQIVPIAISDAEKLDQLRQMAGGKFLSAAKPGPYIYTDMDTIRKRAAMLGGAGRKQRGNAN